MRIRNTTLVWIVLFIAGIVCAQDNEFRKWQLRDGRRTRSEMKVVEIDGRVVSLQREGSERVTRIVISSLVDEDQAYLKEKFPEKMAERQEAARPAPRLSNGEASSAETRWPAPVVKDENLEKWVTFLQPTEEDLTWRKIRWHNNLADAEREARKLQRPILLWTMNGNPCGET